MKKIMTQGRILFMLSLVSTGYTKAQDKLYLNDNTVKEVKVLEIGPEKISYQFLDTTISQTYKIDNHLVNTIVYENGQFEVINKTSRYHSNPIPKKKANARSDSRQKDSLAFSQDSRSIAINLFNLVNHEIGLLLEKEITQKQLSILMPISFGYGKPSLTESNYFYNYGQLSLNRKIIEIGLGLNFYPFPKKRVNYYVGALLKFMKYDITQYHSYYINYQPWCAYGCGNNANIFTTIKKDGYLYSYTASISNGVIIRFKKMYSCNLFGSVGYKYNLIENKIIDPITKQEVPSFIDPVQLYIYLGCALGLTF